MMFLQLYLKNIGKSHSSRFGEMASCIELGENRLLGIPNFYNHEIADNNSVMNQPGSRPELNSCLNLC